MSAITLRNIPPEIQKAIRAKAKQRRISMNRAVLELLAEHLGTQQKKTKRTYNDLDDLFGSWSSTEAKAFDKVLQEQRRIDKDLWR